MSITLNYDVQHGLVLTWKTPHGLDVLELPVRVELHGQHTFYVWGSHGVDSGESAPAWAEPELHLTCFQAEDTEFTYVIETIYTGDCLVGYRAIARGSRAEVTLEVRPTGDEGWTAQLSVANPQGDGGIPLPLCLVALHVDALTVGDGSTFQSGHPYGGNTHPFGTVAGLQQTQGVDFIHGCIGLALPLVYLHAPTKEQGIEFEFMLEGRPTAWLRPGHTSAHAQWSIEWTPDRLLAPSQTHLFGGHFVVRGYRGRSVEQLRAWRDSAKARYGICARSTPRWARHATVLGLMLTPDNPFFARFDAPEAREWLRRWKAMGATALFAIACNPTGTHALSPFDYTPPISMGGIEAERQFLAWVHEEGMHAGLWFTTVGLDRMAEEVSQHADWWTHRGNQDLFYAWDSTPATHYIGYAPDADPLSSGWRDWLKEQAHSLITRGWDGLFIDGCIPRASNHARWDWPGAARNAVPDQVLDLVADLHTQNPATNVWIEDNALYAQTAGGVTHSRYFPTPPRLKKALWDPGMRGGPESIVAAPEEITPEMARDYQLLRFASHLPGIVATEGISGYISESCRPWQVTAVMAGSCVVVDWQDDPGAWTPNVNYPEPPVAERAREHRLRGHAEFLALLQLIRTEPVLLREAPMSMEAVLVDGDAAVLGIVRPGTMRGLLAVIQYANRPAHVCLRLGEPVDVPAIQRVNTEHLHQQRWIAHELMHSLAEQTSQPDGLISSEHELAASLGPYGFRIFALELAT